MSIPGSRRAGAGPDTRAWLQDSRTHVSLVWGEGVCDRRGPATGIRAGRWAFNKRHRPVSRGGVLSKPSPLSEVAGGLIVRADTLVLRSFGSCCRMTPRRSSLRGDAVEGSPSARRCALHQRANEGIVYMICSGLSSPVPQAPRLRGGKVKGRSVRSVDPEMTANQSDPAPFIHFWFMQLLSERGVITLTVYELLRIVSICVSS